MDMQLRDSLARSWSKYFGTAELPLAFFYRDDPGTAEIAPEAPYRGACLIGSLSRVRRGTAVAFPKNGIGCPGGRRYLGFTTELMKDFEYFLSCGIPGRLEGERYKKAPELVRDLMRTREDLAAPARYAVFKRWDLLDESDEPEVIIVFSQPDTLSALFTLANFDRVEPAVIAPMCAGCASIAEKPRLEGSSPAPRAVLGMFDPSARPYVGADVLSFAVPARRFAEMAANMDESFLITDSWSKIRRRMGTF